MHEPGLMVEGWFDFYPDRWVNMIKIHPNNAPPAAIMWRDCEGNGSLRPGNKGQGLQGSVTLGRA